MRVWAIQPQSLYEKLQNETFLHCDPSKSEHLMDWGFQPDYDWLVEQMIKRVGLPPQGIHSIKVELLVLDLSKIKCQCLKFFGHWHFCDLCLRSKCIFNLLTDFLNPLIMKIIIKLRLYIWRKANMAQKTHISKDIITKLEVYKMMKAAHKAFCFKLILVT